MSSARKRSALHKANLKLGKDKGVVDIGNSVYVNAKWAVNLAKEVKKEQE